VMLGITSYNMAIVSILYNTSNNDNLARQA